MKGTYFLSQKGSEAYFFLNKDVGIIYIIIYKKDPGNNLQKEFEQIVNSFKILPLDSKYTYSNDIISFSFTKKPYLIFRGNSLVDDRKKYSKITFRLPRIDEYNKAMNEISDNEKVEDLKVGNKNYKKISWYEGGFYFEVYILKERDNIFILERQYKYEDGLEQELQEILKSAKFN